jgi:hypothetical protein
MKKPKSKEKEEISIKDFIKWQKNFNIVDFLNELDRLRVEKILKKLIKKAKAEAVKETVEKINKIKMKPEGDYIKISMSQWNKLKKSLLK